MEPTAPQVRLRGEAHPPRSLRQRQIALLVLCTGILITTIDGSAVYVALPSIQRDLGFTQSDLAWVVNAFLIPFGGVLLFAGRLGDLLGPKRVFVGGLLTFTAASLGCAVADAQLPLVLLRFAQGVGGGFATAVVLSMIVTLFPHPREQAKAISLYGFIAASAAALGLIAGAVVTQAVGWHWIFFINVPIGAATIAGTIRIVDDVRESHRRPRLDVLGAIVLVVALTLTVYTIVQAGTHGWGTVRTAAMGVASLVLLALFAVRQTQARDPLLPLGLLRARNVTPANLVLAAMVAGPTGMFFLTGLYLRQVQGLSALQLGFAFFPVTAAVGVGSLKGAPRLLRENDAKLVLLPAYVLIVGGLALLSRLPAHAHYLTDILPGMIALGIGSGVATPAILGIALAEATESDSGARSGLINMTQQVGSAIGLAIMAPVAASITAHALRHGHAVAVALTDGYRAAFLVGVGITGLGLLAALTILERETPRTAPSDLDEAKAVAGERRVDDTGVTDADLLAIGLGGTNMMSMLWSVAMGRRAVGVELRGGPYFGIMQWAMSEDLYHHLALIDRLIAERYGEDRVPRRGDGSIFRLHECLWRAGSESTADARADEVVTAWYQDAYIAAPVQSTEYVDDRYVDGRPQRTITALPEAEPNPECDPSRVGRDMAEVIAERATFLVGAEELLLLLRRYLEAMERMDLAAGLEPRCRVFTYHRVVPSESARSWWRRLLGQEPLPAGEEGIVREADGRIRVRVEAIRELDDKRTYRRVREPGTRVLDLGVPELVLVAEGIESEDAARLGFTQQQLVVDHGDGRGPVLAQADYVVGVVGGFFDNRERHRIASAFDSEGNEYWVRQTGIGHDALADTAWFVCEVPDFKTFDPVMAGVLPRGTTRHSRKYEGAYKFLIKDFFWEQVSLITEVPKERLGSLLAFFGPRMVTVISRIGDDALVAANAVVAGDSFGNGTFLDSHGAHAGVLGHASRVLTYWRERDAGVTAHDAIRSLADRIRTDTETWLTASQPAFAQPAKPLLQVEQRRAKVVGIREREAVLESIRRRRRRIRPVVYRDDWSRLDNLAGYLHTDRFPELRDTHPDAVAAMDSAQRDEAGLTA